MFKFMHTHTDVVHILIVTQSNQLIKSAASCFAELISIVSCLCWCPL